MAKVRIQGLPWELDDTDDLDRCLIFHIGQRQRQVMAGQHPSEGKQFRLTHVCMDPQCPETTHSIRGGLHKLTLLGACLFDLGYVSVLIEDEGYATERDMEDADDAILNNPAGAEQINHQMQHKFFKTVTGSTIQFKAIPEAASAREEMFLAALQREISKEYEPPKRSWWKRLFNLPT